VSERCGFGIGGAELREKEFDRLVLIQGSHVGVLEIDSALAEGSHRCREWSEQVALERCVLLAVLVVVGSSSESSDGRAEFEGSE